MPDFTQMQLTQLAITYAPFKEVPPALQCMKTLQSLTVTSHRPMTCGTWIADLSRLQVLKLTINDFPPCLGRMRQLKELTLPGLNKVPEDIVNLQHLVYLDIRKGRFTTIPHLQAIKSLRILRVHQCYEDILPRVMCYFASCKVMTDMKFKQLTMDSGQEVNRDDDAALRRLVKRYVTIKRITHRLDLMLKKALKINPPGLIRYIICCLGRPVVKMKYERGRRLKTEPKVTAKVTRAREKLRMEGTLPTFQ